MRLGVKKVILSMNATPWSKQNEDPRPLGLVRQDNDHDRDAGRLHWVEQAQRLTQNHKTVDNFQRDTEVWILLGMKA